MRKDNHSKIANLRVFWCFCCSAKTGCRKHFQKLSRSPRDLNKKLTLTRHVDLFDLYFFVSLPVREDPSYKEKTIMVVGATGVGKSTLIDGLINFHLGVAWNETARFKLISLTPEEEEKRTEVF